MMLDFYPFAVSSRWLMTPLAYSRSRDSFK